MKILKEATEILDVNDLIKQYGLDKKITLRKGGYSYYVFYKLEKIDGEQRTSKSYNGDTVNIIKPAVKATALMSSECFKHCELDDLFDEAKKLEPKINAADPMKYVGTFKTTPLVSKDKKYVTKVLVTKVYDIITKDEEATNKNTADRLAKEKARYEEVHETKLPNGKVVKYKLDGPGDSVNMNSMYGHTSQSYLVVNSDELTIEDVRKAFNSDDFLTHVSIKNEKPFKVTVTRYND